VANPIRAVSLCAGYGGLDIGFESACEHLGFESRTVAYVEWEAYAAALILQRMADKALAPAPVWCGDLGRLNGLEFRGRIDAVLAGFPCQPHSAAGKRAGIADERWIWPAIARFIRESGAWLVVLENVPGLLSSGGFAPVLTDLAEMGFDAEWLVLSAASVGASHKRERVFIVAYAPGERRQQGFTQQPGRVGEFAPDQPRGPMADGDRSSRKRQCADSIDAERGPDGRRHDSGSCADVVDASGAEGWRNASGQRAERGSVVAGAGCAMADASQPGRERRELGTTLHDYRGGVGSTWIN